MSCAGRRRPVCQRRVDCPDCAVASHAMLRLRATELASSSRSKQRKYDCGQGTDALHVQWKPPGHEGAPAWRAVAKSVHGLEDNTLRLRISDRQSVSHTLTRRAVCVRVASLSGTVWPRGGELPSAGRAPHLRQAVDLWAALLGIVKANV